MKCYVTGMQPITRAQASEEKKLSEIFGKKGLALKPQHLVVVEAIFLFLGSSRHSLYFFVVTGLVQH